MPLLPQDPAQQKKLLIGILPLLAFGAYMMWYHPPLQAEVETLQARLDDLSRKNQIAQAEAQKGGDLERRVALLEPHILRLEKLIPNEEEVADLLHDMTLRAQENGVDLAKLKPEAEEAGQHYTQHTFEIVVLGHYHDIGRFLASVGSLPRIITPVNLGLIPRPKDAKPGEMPLQANFRILTFVKPASTLPENASPNAQS